MSDEANTTVQANVSSALARRLIDAGRAHTDTVGKALERMDGAALSSIQIAQDKAYTAVGFGIPAPPGTTSSRTTRPWPPAPPAASTAWWSSAAASPSPSPASWWGRSA
jgi:uncharacterized protein GlcG (DUF336 family)